MENKALGIGIGFRTFYLSEIQKENVSIDWFELIVEHFLKPTKRSLYILDFLKHRFPLVLHGVGLSIGNPAPLDFDYLKRLKSLARETNAPWASDHLSWGQIPGAHFHSLFPLPFKKQVADFVAERARIIQDYLEIPFALENISTFVQSEDKDMEEWEFYAYVVEKADIRMMLDVNNIIVSSQNVGFDPENYIADLPFERIIQMHLAGHTSDKDWTHDTHDCPVKDDVWALYRRIWLQASRPATLLEWDDKFPPFKDICDEALKAKLYQTDTLHACTSIAS